MKLLLEGSQGQMTVVILLKLEPIDFRRDLSLPTLESGFVEVWEWDTDNLCVKLRGPREV
jgi:hypothetical protein